MANLASDAGELSPDLLALVETLQAARRDADAAEAVLLALCMKAESEKVALWREHWATFDLFLEKFRICDSTRYREYVAAQGMRDVAARANEIGVAAVLQAGKIVDPGRRAKFIEAAVERLQSTGVPLSDQQARTMRIRVGGSQPQDSAWNKRADEREQLKREKLELERKLYAAEQEIAELREENAKMKKALTGGGDKKKK